MSLLIIPVSSDAVVDAVFVAVGMVICAVVFGMAVASVEVSFAVDAISPVELLGSGCRWGF